MYYNSVITENVQETNLIKFTGKQSQSQTLNLSKNVKSHEVKVQINLLDKANTDNQLSTYLLQRLYFRQTNHRTKKSGERPESSEKPR